MALVGRKEEIFVFLVCRNITKGSEHFTKQLLNPGYVREYMETVSEIEHQDIFLIASPIFLFRCHFKL